MRELRKQLDELLKQSGGNKNVIEMIKKEKAIFPFSTEGRIFAYLLATQTITYEKYVELQDAYAKRNQYLDLFEMAHVLLEKHGERNIFLVYFQNL